jgi:hypothetical protein
MSAHVEGTAMRTSLLPYSGAVARQCAASSSRFCNVNVNVNMNVHP